VLAPDLKDVVILTAESSFATAECGYDANGNWYCTYTRKPGNPISAPSTPDDLEVPFGETYTVTENPIIGWNAANGVGMGFQRIEGFDANALPNSLEYELATTVYSNNIPNELLKYGSHVVENESVNVDCADAVNYLQTYGLIVLEDLNTNSEVEYNTFVGGDVLNLGTSGNQLSSISPSLPSSYLSIEVAGQVQDAFNILDYSAAFSPSNTITTVNASQVNVNGSYLFNVASGASVSTDGTLGNKATHIKNALETASIQLSNAAANNTISVSGNNVDFVVNTVDANGIAVFDIASTDLFANAQAELTNPNNLTINTVVINVSGTNINWPSSIALNGTWFNSQNGRSKTIWNFHEATSLSFDFNFKGVILAPDATFSTNQNVEGTVAVKAVTNSGQFHQPYFAGDFSSLCSPSNGVVSPLCVPQGDTYALDFDTDDQGNSISAGTGIGNSGSLIQPYANLFGPGEGINIVSGDEANHPLSTYDSEGNGGNDTDLERNFGGSGTWATGNLTNEILGNLLIINENSAVSDPDDNINGGDIIFTSDVPLESFSMDLVDMQTDEIDNNDIITFTNTALNLSTIIPMADFEDIMSNTSIFKRAGVTYGDRSGNRITNITAADLGLPSFDQITFTTDATFAIAGICVEKAPCSIAVQFSQECDGSSATLINVTGTGAPSGKFVVKELNGNTVLAMGNNGETATFTGTIGTNYVVEDAVSASCNATFTTNVVTGCDDEETCPTAVFFDMSTHGFAQSGLIGTNGNFNAVIGGNFTVSSNGAVGDTEGRLAIGGNFSNNNSSTYTIGGGNPSGTGGLNAPAGEDNLVVVGDIDGPVGVRGNVVYGGMGSGISFIDGQTGVERNINDVNANVLNIPAAIADFQARSNALDACASGTLGSVTDDGSGNFTLDGQNASGLVRFDLASATAGSSYDFVNVDNASAILINVAGTTVEFSGGSIALNGNTVPTYPIDNSPSGELAFVEKTLWNFPQATSFNLTSYAIMGSVLAPNADATLSGGGINGQVVFGGNVTTSGGFEFHNFCYTADIDLVCSLFYDFGDLPNSYPQARAEVEDNNNDGTPDGANSVWAGTIVDTEGAQNFSANADGDDQDGSDDEDGLTLPTLTPGQTSTVTISLNSAANNTKVYYGLWFDYNCDGDFTDADDQFYSGSKTVATGGNPETENISVTPPLSATGDYKVRLIVSDDPISSNDFGNTFDNGEVEDYKGTMLCDMSLTDLTVSSCSNNNYTFTFDVEWVGGPTTGDFEVIVYENDVPGSPQTITRTNFNAAGTQMIDINAACDAEINKIEVRFKDQATCTALAVFPAEPIDPQGYIYCVGTGEIITGGTISVTPPQGGSAVIYSDGSNGFYDFFSDGTPGVYTITYNPPMGYSLTGTPGDRVGDTDDVLDPMAGSEDNPMGMSPLVLGSEDADNNGFLDDFNLQNNPFFLEVNIVNGMPAVMNNNIPLNCPTVVTPECVSVEEPNFESVSTAMRDKSNGGGANLLTISKPSGVAIGDLLLAAIAVDGDKTVTAPTNSNPWMLFNEGSSNGGNNDGTSLAIFYKIADASDVSASSYTFTASANAQMAGAILRYSNVDTSDPINSVFGVANAPAESNMPTAPDVTSPINLPKVLRIFAADDDELPVTHPSGHNDIVELESRTGQGNSFPDRVTLGIAEKNTQQGIGSTGDGKFTISGSEQWRAITILINPAPGSGNAPSFATPTSAVGSCRQGVPQEDATITLENIMNADRIDISSPGATSYDGDDYADAESLNGNTEFTFSGLMHTTQYIIRVFNGDDNCYTDVAITTAFIECSPAICEEGTIIDFDFDDQGVMLMAGDGSSGSGITIGNGPGEVQPYEDVFGGPNSGMGVTFTTDNPSTKPLTLYNSELVGGLDPDLERNFGNTGCWAFGNIPKENVKNLLIVNQDTDVDKPNDSGGGGEIFSMSTMLLKEISFDIVDLESVGSNDKVIFENSVTGEMAEILLSEFVDGSGSMFEVPGVEYGDRSANRITGITADKLGISGFDVITFDTDDSFGIGTICMVKCPIEVSISGGASITCDESIGISSTVSGTTGTVTYEWYRDDGNGYELIDNANLDAPNATYSGFNGPTLTINPDNQTGDQISGYVYRLFVTDDDCTSNSQEFVLTVSCNAMPVELLTFTATPVDNERVFLKWSTATETNNAYFSVQRSKDGTNWYEIGQVKGAGNSLETLHYSYWDEAPLTGINYYRLQQFDYDGQFEYHKVVSVNINGKQQAQDINVYPTVAKNNVNIAFAQPTESDEELYVLDLTGRVLLHKTIAAGTEQYALNIGELVSGHYIIMIRAERTIRKGKFVKG